MKIIIEANSIKELKKLLTEMIEKREKVYEVDPTLAPSYKKPVGRPKSTQPKGYKGRFDYKVRVNPTISLEEQLKKAGITSYLNLDKIKDWGDFKTPNKPYTIWLNNGVSNKGKSVKEVRENLKSDERGATVLEVVSLYAQYPEVLKGTYLDCPGSEYGSVDAPFLCHWDERSVLDYYFTGVALSYFGSVVASKKIDIQ